MLRCRAVPVAENRRAEQREAGNAEGRGEMGSRPVHGQHRPGICTKPEVFLEGCRTGEAFGTGSCFIGDFPTLCDLPVGAGPGEKNRKIQSFQNPAPTVCCPGFMTPSGGRIDEEVSAGNAAWRGPCGRWRFELRGAERALGRHGRVGPKKLGDIGISEIRGCHAREENRVEPAQFPLFGRQELSRTNRCEQRARRRFAQGIEAIKMPRRNQRDPADKTHAGDQPGQRGMARAREESNRRAVVVAQPRQAGLEQNEIAKLLVKNGVASGHRECKSCSRHAPRQARMCGLLFFPNQIA